MLPLAILGLFDWVPDWDVEVYGVRINLAWVIIIGFCFGVSALFVFDPCQTTIFASSAGNQCN